MKSQNRVGQHTQEFREKSVKLALNGNKSIAATARVLGVNISTLHTWINKYRDEVDIKPSTNLEARVIEQEKEIRGLREERDILRKAAVGSSHHFPKLNSSDTPRIDEVISQITDGNSSSMPNQSGSRKILSLISIVQFNVFTGG